MPIVTRTNKNVSYHFSSIWVAITVIIIAILNYGYVFNYLFIPVQQILKYLWWVMEWRWVKQSPTDIAATIEPAQDTVQLILPVAVSSTDWQLINSGEMWAVWRLPYIWLLFVHTNWRHWILYWDYWVLTIPLSRLSNGGWLLCAVWNYHIPA